MFGLEVSFNGKVQKLYNDATKRQLGLAIARYVQTEIVPVSERRMNDTLAKEPRKQPEKKLDWTSPAQRVAVMAKLRKADNIPYKRKHTLVKQWRVISVVRPTTGQVIMENPVPIAQYVYGSRIGKHQQRFHKNTGWPLAEQFFIAEQKRTRDQLAGAWPDIVDDVRRANS